MAEPPTYLLLTKFVVIRCYSERSEESHGFICQSCLLLYEIL